MKQLNIGMLGFGFMGKTHLYAVRNLPFFCDVAALPFEARVTALCTAHPRRAAELCAAWDIPRAMSEDEILSDPEINVVDVCTPNHLHYATVKAALLAGKHVLCEKPLTVTVSEAEELTRLAGERGLTCGMVFNNRFLPPVMRAAGLIGEGRLGRILSFDFSYKHNSCLDPTRRAGWKQNADFGGGTLADLGPHVIDLCHYLCGELSWISGRGQIACATHPDANGDLWQTNADEAFYMLCGTADGACGTITVSKLVQGANDELTFTVHGSRGSLSFSLMDPNYLYVYDATAESAPIGGMRGYTRIECVGRYPSPASGFPTVKASVGWLRGHVFSMANYLTAVAEERPCVPSFEDGLYVQRIMDAARRSAAEGREVTLC